MYIPVISMSITQFLNPNGEEVYDAEEVVIDDIVISYSMQEKAYEIDEEDRGAAPISDKRSSSSPIHLTFYKEQQDVGDSELISRLGRHERAIRQRTEQGSSSPQLVATSHRKLGLAGVLLGMTI